jgi:hypothetical protein
MDQLEQVRSDASQWGGGALALGTLTYAFAVIAYVVVYGQPEPSAPGFEPTMANRVAHLQKRWRTAQFLWLIEALAALPISVAGFVLQRRVTSVRTKIPPGFAWTTVGVAGIFLSLMNPVVLCGYRTAAAAFVEQPAVFGTINGIAIFIFNFGNTILFLGVTG